MPDINFFDNPGQAPQPRDQIRVEDVTLEPYPDGRRVKIGLHITPFRPADRPNLDIAVHNKKGQEVATMSVIESLENDFALTIHLRGEEVAQGTCNVEVRLFYDPESTQDSKTVSFVLPPGN